MTVKSKHHSGRHHHNGRHHHSQYDLADDVERLKAALFDTTQDLKGRAGEMITDSMGSMKEQTVAARDNVADYAASKPFKALSIALAAGVVLGWLIKR